MTRIAIKEHVFSMMSDNVVFEVLTLVVRVSLIGTLFARAHIGHEIRLIGRIRYHHRGLRICSGTFRTIKEYQYLCFKEID